MSKRRVGEEWTFVDISVCKFMMKGSGGVLV